MSNLLTSLTSAANSMTAYEKAMSVVSNDTVNSNTPGYAKQSVAFKSLPFNLQGAQAGGVGIAQVISSRDEYAERNVQVQQTALGLSATLQSHLSGIEPVFDLQSTTGIAGSLNSLFSSFSQLEVGPNDAQERESVINAASALAGAFNVASNSLAQATASIVSDTQNNITDINSLTADIANINVQIRQNASGSIDPGVDAQLHNDLESLSKFADIATVQAQDGSFSVFLGGQVPLVMGSTQFSISASNSSGSLSIHDENGNDITSHVTNGQLGALKQLQNTTIPGYQSQLDQLATSVADTINAQLASGVDQNGNPGTPLFTYNAAAPAKTLALTSITSAQLAAASSANPGGNDNAIALAHLQNTAVSSLGNFSFTGYYGNLSSAVGRDISNATNDQTTHTQLLAQAQSVRSESSSVSLDEEAANLESYQRSYDAISKLFSVIDTMTQTLIGLIPTQ
jgi:flagellar hook-associated protein 1 FlgK